MKSGSLCVFVVFFLLLNVRDITPYLIKVVVGTILGDSQFN